jgi:hypothetical protein
LKLTEAWGTRDRYTHNWDAYWNSSLFWGLSGVHYNGSAAARMTAKGQNCATCMVRNKLSAAAGTISADFSCNPDFAVYQIGFNTKWTPVKNLTSTTEMQYLGLDQHFTGTAMLTPAPPKPSARYESKDQNTVLLEVRVQRNF